MSDRLSRVFAALADPTRRDMVARLTTADATVGELAEPYDVSVQAVSKHLKVLEDAGLVSRSKEAQRRPVHLEAEVFDLMTKWIERYRQQAETRYRQLDAVLAEMNEQDNPHRKERHHERHDQRGHHRGRRDTADDPHDARLRGHATTAHASTYRPRAVRAMGRTERHGDAHRRLGRPRRRRVAVRRRTKCRRWGEEYAFRGCFHRVGDDVIVQTFTFEPEPEGVALETLRFEDLGDGRTRLHAQSLVDSFEGRDALLRSGMEVGVNEGYAKLDRLIADGDV